MRRPGFRRNSIRFKILLTLTILSVSGYAFVLLLNDINNAKDFVATTQQKISADCLRYITSINSYTDLMFANGNSTARTGEILFNEYTDSGDLKKKLNDYLISQVRRNPTLYGSGIWYEPDLFPENEFIGPYAYWNNNEVLLTYEFSEHDFTKDQWYQTGLPEYWDRKRKRNKEQYVTPPYDYGDGHVYITIDTLMYSGNSTIIGLTSTDWTLDFLPALLKGFSITENSTVYLLDPGTGKYLLHKNPDLIFTDYKNMPWSSNINSEIPGDKIQIVENVQIDGIKSTLFFGRTGLNYILVFSVPDREAYSNLVRLRQINTQNVIMILLVSLLILYYLIQRMIFNPLLLLKDATINFGTNNFQTRAPVLNPFDEVGKLSINFNQMARQLEKSFHDLNKSRENLIMLNEELETKVAERTDYLQEVIKTLETTQEQLILYERVASTSNMISGMAHQINTPLGIAITASTYLETQLILNAEGELKPDIKKAVELVISNLKKTAQLIQAFKKLSVKQYIEQKREFYLKDFIETTLSTMHETLTEEKVEVLLNCRETIKLKSYAGIFSQIFLNLISNSLSHGNHEMSEILTISISVKYEYSQLIISFSDNGKGIEKTNLSRIFEPFFSTGKGTGLGLNVIYNLITQKLDGQIICSSTSGKGTTFTIFLPIDIVVENESGNISPPE